LEKVKFPKSFAPSTKLPRGSAPRRRYQGLLIADWGGIAKKPRIILGFLSNFYMKFLICSARLISAYKFLISWRFLFVVISPWFLYGCPVAPLVGGMINGSGPLAEAVLQRHNSQDITIGEMGNIWDTFKEWGANS
jgi:hypothetical protein